MDPAWQVRSSQRQSILDKITEKYRAKINYLFEREGSGENSQEKVEDDFCKALLVTISLGRRQRNDLLFSLHANEFWDEISGMIREFSRAPEEEKAIVWRFAMEILQSKQIRVDQALNHVEHENPQKLLHASSSMEEIEIPPREDD